MFSFVIVSPNSPDTLVGLFFDGILLFGIALIIVDWCSRCKSANNSINISSVGILTFSPFYFQSQYKLYLQFLSTVTNFQNIFLSL